MNSHDGYDTFFEIAMGGNAHPYPYQRRLACELTFPEVLTVPTGLGKTAAVILAWLWRRRFHDSPSVRADTPRRLVYCLPMRVLVEQTLACAGRWLTALDLSGEVRVHALMGGDADLDFDLHPERDAVLAGTQDMLLSRALNRGYAMSRHRWPQHFALLNNDALWVLDEVQLMGSGLATSAQLAAFREAFGTCGPCRSLWMSATLAPDWLATVDLAPRAAGFRPWGLEDDDRATESARIRLEAQKRLARLEVELSRETVKAYGKRVAAEILALHRPTTLSLAIVNTVERAVAVYDALRRDAPRGPDLLLLHSRFRPVERQQQREQLESPIPPEGRVIVSTQVVEAGADLDAALLVTELAPIASLVQRFGRCNRGGRQEGAQVRWIEVDPAFAAPYSELELEAARVYLRQHEDVGPARLAPADLAPGYRTVLRRRDLVDLFDTAPDLGGADLDVSPFIREEKERDAHVFWRADLGGEPNRELARDQRSELCPVSISELRKWLQVGKDAWRFDFLEGGWEKLTAKAPLFPGMTVLLRAEQGGYDERCGFLRTSTAAVSVVAPEDDRRREGLMQEADSEQPSFQTLDEHTTAVLSVLAELLSALPAGARFAADLETAARWHDLGKAHEEFQFFLLGDPPAEDRSRLWAKTARVAPRHRRRRFRHELASGLAMLQNGCSDLAAYLAAAHHGRVRLSIRSVPDEPLPRSSGGEPESGRRFALGVWEGDLLPAVALSGGHVMPPTCLDLSPMELGDGPLGPSWTARMIALRDSPAIGPFCLAFLETVLRAADRRASERKP
ncbi:MAG: CRISPR-associated helicase Cas3' [Candidatus Schekmanbacteria bacterium]|nr:CRISPR-associated helicase Cas3' [Candidatus Schekmanbacteria bacterium]